MRVKVPNWIQVKIDWRTITDSDQGDWPFRRGSQMGPNVRTLAIGPQIYRFLFHEKPIPSCYIGESERFEQRFQRYLQTLQMMRSGKPARESTAKDLEIAIKKLRSDSKIRVGAHILNAEQDGTKIDLQLIDFPGFLFNKAEISASSLTSPFHRRAMENLAILDADNSGLRVLNRGRDVSGKDFARLFAKRTKRNTATGTSRMT